MRLRSDSMPAIALALAALATFVVTFACVGLTLSSEAAAKVSWLIRDGRSTVAGSVTLQSDGLTYCVFYSGGLLGDVVQSSSDVWVLHDNSAGGRTLTINRVAAARYEFAGGQGRAVRTDARWSIQKRLGGRWKLVGWAPRSCNGAVALGAGRLLVWSGPVPLPVRSWNFTSANGKVAGTINEMSQGTNQAQIRPSPYEGYPRGWVSVSQSSAEVQAYRGVITTLVKVSAEKWRTSGGEGYAALGVSRWVAYEKVDGIWKKVGSAPKSCSGAYTLGAAQLLGQ